jgi:hypothetical protein
MPNPQQPVTLSFDSTSTPAACALCGRESAERAVIRHSTTGASVELCGGCGEALKAACVPWSQGAGSFGAALAPLQRGERVCRRGWNGRGQYLILIRGGGLGDYSIGGAAVAEMADTTSFSASGLLPWIGIKTADDKFVPWTVSQTDALAQDWEIVPNAS